MTANCTCWGADPQVSQTCAIAESKEMAMAQHPATSQVTPLQESPLHTSQSLISQDSAGSPVEKERASSHVAEAGICGAVWCGQGGCRAVYGHLVCSVGMINLWNKGWQSQSFSFFSSATSLQRAAGKETDVCKMYVRAVPWPCCWGYQEAAAGNVRFLTRKHAVVYWG